MSENHVTEVLAQLKKGYSLSLKDAEGLEQFLQLLHKKLTLTEAKLAAQNTGGSLNWTPTSENCLLPGYTVEQMIAYGDARVAAFKKEIGYE